MGKRTVQVGVERFIRVGSNAAVHGGETPAKTRKSPSCEHRELAATARQFNHATQACPKDVE